MKKISEYSKKNRALILQQHPGATILAGAKEWQELGYNIKPGERPIIIWAPVEDKDGRAISWVQVYVYDISQVQKKNSSEK